MIAYRLLADLVVAIHAGYVAFVVFGLVATIVGLIRGRSWARNFWFRTAHLAMIGVVVVESYVGLVCPLTSWEAALRRAAGQEGYSGSFLGYWTHRLLFFHAEEWVFTVIYSLFGLAVLATFVLGPPRRPRGRRDQPTWITPDDRTSAPPSAPMPRR
jgi:hypothetical protein